MNGTPSIACSFLSFNLIFLKLNPGKSAHVIPQQIPEFHKHNTNTVIIERLNFLFGLDWFRFLEAPVTNLVPW